MKYLIISMIVLALAGCAGPYVATSVEQGTAQGTLRFADVPIGALILVDGKQRASRLGEEPVVVEVEPGKHLVEETNNRQIQFHSEYYVGAGSTVEVRSVK
jgi:hypothetical protein